LLAPVIRIHNRLPQAAFDGIDWHELLAENVSTSDMLPKSLRCDDTAINAVAARYPMSINPYYLSLIQAVGDPLWRQAVPDALELSDDALAADPSTEEVQSPVPGLTHRYPDRVLFYVSSRCAMYCRFCMRKRKVGQAVESPETIGAALSYIEKTPAVREVILSGGDPLLLEDEQIAGLLSRLRAIGHVEVIRIHSRVPCTLPQRITADLAAILRAGHPLFVNTHFNHPAELSPRAVSACARLADAGIALGCQTVLLKGVNDDPALMRDLMRKLLAARIRPYYLHHPDPVRGTAHFRVPIAKGLAIMESLRGHLSGMAVPQYMIDLPGGGGKIPLLPQYIVHQAPGILRVRNFAGDCFDYPDA
jgi:lysine 2,3-aminomutase